MLFNRYVFLEDFDAHAACSIIRRGKKVRGIVAKERCKTAKKGDVQGLGRSRGGMSTKIHAATGALGLPVRLIATPGQHNDITYAHDLIDGIEANALLADKVRFVTNAFWPILVAWAFSGANYGSWRRRLVV